MATEPKAEERVVVVVQDGQVVSVLMSDNVSCVVLDADNKHENLPPTSRQQKHSISVRLPAFGMTDCAVRADHDYLVRPDLVDTVFRKAGRDPDPAPTPSPRKRP